MAGVVKFDIANLYNKVLVTAGIRVGIIELLNKGVKTLILGNLNLSDKFKLELYR